MSNEQSIEQDKQVLHSIIKEISQSMTGEQSTRHWAENAVWYDIPPFASMGIKPAYNKFNEAFSQLKSIDVRILETDTYINGDMGVVCSIQEWTTVTKDGVSNPPMFVRQTNCFERQNGEWKVIHEHSSIPAGNDWDGKIITE